MADSGTPPVLRFNQAKKLIDIALLARRNVMIWGPPGIGKTDLVAEIANEREIPLVTVNAPQMESVDFRGIPFTTTRKGISVTNWAPATFMVPDDPVGILFIDEITSAQPSTVLPAMQLFLDHRIGDVSLPVGWSVMAAGNRVGDNSHVYDLPSPMRNRMVQLTLSPSTEEWLLWAERNHIDPRIINFLRAKPRYIYDEAHSEETVFPTARTWAFLSAMLQALPAGEEKFPLHLAQSVVGPVAASTFVASLTGTTISPADIRRNPQKIPLPPPAELSLIVRNLAASASATTSFQDVAFLERLNRDYVELYLSALTNQSLIVEMKQWLK